MRLKGKTAVITAAGAGIGRATAVAFAEQGARVIATDINTNSFAELQKLGIETSKLDVLDSFKEIKICIGYKLYSKKIDYFPLSESDQRVIKPIYETHKGWMESTQGARSWTDLPALAIKYVRRIEELLQTQVSLLSTSPRREDTILVRNPFY